jgi:putative flippase GtrA
MRQHLTLKNLKQFLGYGAVGVLNTALNFLIVNLLIVLTGITSGLYFLVFSFVAFLIVVVHSFVWNKYLIFARQQNNELRHREYVAFFGVTTATTILNLGVLQLIVNIIGPQWGIGAHIWANIAIAITIPIAVVCNFLGYKLFVFKEHMV